MTTLCPLLRQAVERGQASGGLIDTDGSFQKWEVIEAQARRLATHLVAAGVEPGDRVAVLHPRSTASFLAVHATLQAGGVMVPLDPFGPVAALAEVLDAVEPVAIIGAAQTIASRVERYVVEHEISIVHTGPGDQLSELGIAPDRLIDFSVATTTHAAVQLPTAAPDDAAYIIFTSGSTGIPKGIVHTHASGLAYAEMAAHAHAMSNRDRLAAISPMHFDQSTLDLYAVPLVGATAIAMSEVQLRFPATLSQRLADHSATMIYTTPYQLLQLMHRGDLANRDLSDLRQIGFGGEAFAPGVLVELGATFPPAELLNVYGPAEVNGITVHSFGVRPQSLDDVSIGLPCEGVEIMIVGEDDQPTPPGTAGEMLVHSPTTMQGYWRRDDLNEHCFLTIDDRRFYRTGDLAFVDDTGLLQFEGRRDNRIKVRGVRIELEQIERVLEDAPGVAHAVAVLVDDGDTQQHIAAFIVPEAAGEVDAKALTSWCRDQLPANAVPTKYQATKNLPTTATGKIDRATLRQTPIE